MNFTMLLICIALQLFSFFPVYLTWVRDCKGVGGKENLKESLGTRFKNWVIFCPIWIVAFLPKGE